MSLQLRPEPCWIGLWQGPDVRNNIDRCLHYEAAKNVPSYSSHPGRAARHRACGGVVAFDQGGGFCTLCQEEGLGDTDWEERDYLPAQLEVPCLQAVCDGRCGEPLCDEDSAADFCLADLAQAQRVAARHSLVCDDGETRCWLVTDEGTVWCPADRPEGVYPPLTPAERENAGQLRLPF